VFASSLASNGFVFSFINRFIFVRISIRTNQSRLVSSSDKSKLQVASYRADNKSTAMMF